MNFSDHSCGILTERDAGYINPRDMVDALQSCAEKSGCDIIDDVVKRIIPSREVDGYNVLITDSGRLFYSRKVLLATGAFTHCRRLLPPDVQPDVTLQAEAIAMVYTYTYTNIQTYSNQNEALCVPLVRPGCEPRRLRHPLASRLNAHWQTEWAIEGQVKCIIPRAIWCILRNNNLPCPCITAHMSS